jgi:hypothetical protein
MEASAYLQFNSSKFIINNNFDGSSNINVVVDEPLWYRYNLLASTSLFIAYGLVFVVGLTGNLLVLIAVFSSDRKSLIRQHHHSITNIFLANLAVADLLVIIACLPFTLVTNLVYRKS